MRIFEEREELYRQMDREKEQSNRLSISSKGPKNQSVGPVIRSTNPIISDSQSINQQQKQQINQNPYVGMN
jgi:hypothetical protein